MRKKLNNKGSISLDTLIGLIGVIIFTLILLFACSFTTIKSGEIGLKTRFGKITDTSLKEGINFKIPFIEKIVKVNIKVQKAEMTIEGSTKDLQIVNTNVAVNYRINSEKAPNLYKQVGKSYEETILNPAIKESIKSAIAQYNAEEITVNRTAVSQSCLKAIQDKVEKYGIIIEDFNLTDFSFSEEYTKAIEDKQVAEQKLEKARLEAEKKLVEAEATKEANELLQESLTDELIMKEFIEKWDGELPKVTGSNSMFDLTSILGGNK